MTPADVLAKYIASSQAQRRQAMQWARDMKHNADWLAAYVRVARMWSQRAALLIRERAAL